MSSVVKYVKKKMTPKRSRTATTPTSSSRPSEHSTSSHHSQPHEEEEEVEMADVTPLVQPEGNTYGIIFESQESIDRFVRLNSRRVLNTKFYHKADMQAIGIHSELTILFKNISWGGFLSWDEVGYKRPTLEFLSSCDIFGKTLRFRMFNQPCSMHLDALCILVGQDPNNTFEPFEHRGPFLNELEEAEFWQSITGSDSYEPRHLKTSSIVHPVLRVAARILTCSVFCLDEAGSFNIVGLNLLYHMINKGSRKPHFGEYVAHYIMRNTRTHTTTSIHVSGIITKILKTLQIQIPANEPPLTSDRYLNLQNLIRGSLLKEDRATKTFTWFLGPGKIPHLALKKNEFKLLKLHKTTKETQWLLPSNIGTPGASGSGARASDAETGPTEPAPPIPDPVRHSDASYFGQFQGNYDRLHSDYQGLHSSFTSLQSDYSALYGSYSSMNSDLSSLRTDFNTERDENSRFRGEVRGYMEQSNAQQTSIHDMINSLFHWHPNAPPQQPPNP